MDRYSNHTGPVHLYLIFEKSSSTNWIFSLFRTRFFTAYSLNLIFQKASTDERYRGISVINRALSKRAYKRKKNPIMLKYTMLFKYNNKIEIAFFFSFFNKVFLLFWSPTDCFTCSQTACSMYITQ